jgi:hypothetical protein
MHSLFDIVAGLIGLGVVFGLLGTGIFLWVKKDHDPAKFIFKILFTAGLILADGLFIRFGLGHLNEGLSPQNFVLALFIIISIVICGIILSGLWTSHLSGWIASPLTGIFDGGNEPPESKPFYSIAMTKRNRGKPHEAVMEIRRQLERFPNDFEGILLLARVFAEDLADLAAAEKILRDFCDRPRTPEKYVVAACMQLADWHLKIAADAEAARDDLRKIVERFPGTESALVAEQRIAHLSDAEKMILARAGAQSVELPAGKQNIGLLDSSSFLKPVEVEPGKLAGAYVKHLEQYPHDTEVREKLATIYARDFKRLDLATMELAQLINEPKHQPKQTAHWLNQLANFQVELGADAATVQATLGKIVERFPNLPVADLARRRLARLGNEFKGVQPSGSVKMGSYEQSIGLKYGTPRKR